MPSCPECQGKRWLAYDVPLGHPKFGEIYPCPECKGTGIVASLPQKTIPLPEEETRPCLVCGEAVYAPVTICLACEAKADRDWAEV